MQGHRCDEGCLCPVHHQPMTYAPVPGQHACNVEGCKYFHGFYIPFRGTRLPA